ncbi:MAG TPA: NlpC/P60 family protein [Pseudonocardia sp.]|jgi:cell wall-associated NlpC family hydrolase|nr:NlpC/P60 family protein [Pseudonocardia sp.]
MTEQRARHRAGEQSDPSTERSLSAAELLARLAPPGTEGRTGRPTRHVAPEQDTPPAGLPEGWVGNADPSAVTRVIPAQGFTTLPFPRSPRTAAAAVSVTVLGATAVLTAVGGSVPAGAAAALTTTGTGSIRAVPEGENVQLVSASAPSAMNSTLGSAVGRANDAFPAVFDRADAAGIAANNLALARAAEQKAAAEKLARTKAAQARSALSAQPARGGGSGSGSGDVSAPAASTGSGPGAEALALATGKLGKPYVWGAAGPNSFDCSGLVQWAFSQVGKSLPHSSNAQSQLGTPVSMANLQPGDLVFFYSPVSHVGIYAGNGKILNASTSGEPVKYSDMANMPFHNAVRL